MLSDVLDELLKLAKDAFGVPAQAIIEQFIYAKMLPHLNNSIKQAHLENGKYNQIVSHLEREIELNGLKAPEGLQINTVTQQATELSPEKLKPTCNYCKKPGHYKNQWRQLKREKDRALNNTKSAGNNNNNNSCQTNSDPYNKNTKNTDTNNANNPNDRKPRIVYPLSETYGKINHLTEKRDFGANAANRPPARNRRTEGQNKVQQRENENNSKESTQAVAQTLN